jgi:hypothetical protein
MPVSTGMPVWSSRRLDSFLGRKWPNASLNDQGELLMIVHWKPDDARNHQKQGCTTAKRFAKATRFVMADRNNRIGDNLAPM